MKKLSVITATYNVSSTIIPTLESIRALKDDRMEYIVIDGGSNDNSLEIFQQYSDIIDILVSEPDKGIYDAFNKGAERASGEWFIYINCGDKLLSVPYQVMDLVGKDFFAIGCCTIDQYGDISKPCFDNSMRYGNKVPHQGLLYRNSNEIRFDINFKIFSDYDLNLKFYKEGKRLYFCDEIIAQHNLDGISMNKKYLKECYAVVRKHYGLMGCLALYFHWHRGGLVSRLHLK